MNDQVSHGAHDDSALQRLDEADAYAALGQIALRRQPFGQTLDEVVVLTRRALPEIPEASVTLRDGARPHTAASTGSVALRLDQRQYDADHGPCLDAAGSGRTVQVAMGEPDGPYADFRRFARREGITHSLSVAIPAAGRAIGALNLYSSTGHPFTPDSARIAGTIASITGIALAESPPPENVSASASQLQEALASRALIHQAQGLLMVRLSCSRDQAFDTLLRLSQEQGVKVRDVAESLINEHTRPGSP